VIVAISDNEMLGSNPGIRDLLNQFRSFESNEEKPAKRQKEAKEKPSKRRKEGADKHAKRQKESSAGDEPSKRKKTK